MKYIKLFDTWKQLDINNLYENSAKYEYSCAMIYLDCGENVDIIHSNIEENDLYTEYNNKRYGLEKDHHVTLLYGLHDDEVKPTEVIEICESFEYSPIMIKNISLFENDNYDVLKFDVECETLNKVNKKLTEFPFTSDFPDYHPHVTIAYLKSGKGKKYVKDFKDLEFFAKPIKIVYSRANGSKIESKNIRYIEKENES